MALKAIYASADDVPEEHKDLYSEASDGRFVLDVEDVDNFPKVRGLVTANAENKRKAQERLAKLEEAEAKLSGLPEDFDVDEWERLKSSDKPDEQVQTLKDQHARAVEALRAKHKAELDSITAQVSERDGYIDGVTRDAALQAALDEAGFDPMHKPMLAKFLGDQIKVRREDDGRRVAFADTDLGEVSPLDYVKEFAGKAGKVYLAKASGPGAPGSDKPGRHGASAGDFGGSKEDRQKAIAAKFPELGR